jgi:hypothetical protein
MNPPHYFTLSITCTHPLLFPMQSRVLTPLRPPLWFWITRTHPLASPSLLAQRGGRICNVIQWSPPSLRQQRRGPALQAEALAKAWGDEYMKNKAKKMFN